MVGVIYHTHTHTHFFHHPESMNLNPFPWMGIVVVSRRLSQISLSPPSPQLHIHITGASSKHSSWGWSIIRAVEAVYTPPPRIRRAAGNPLGFFRCSRRKKAGFLCSSCVVRAEPEISILSSNPPFNSQIIIIVETGNLAIIFFIRASKAILPPSFLYY